jgi:chemotaxis protein MotB
MSRRGRGHKGGAHDEGHADERWLVSYADMITVLMCLFLVLFAMSSIDADKYAQLKDSLATGFGTTPSTHVDSAVGVIVDPSKVDEEGIGFTAAETDEESEVERAEHEVAEFEALIQQISANLAAQGLQEQVSFSIDERGLTIKLLGGQTYFAGDSARLQDGAISAIDSVGAALTGVPNHVSVEGHIDPYGQGSPALNDWELAGARSTAVLRRLVETGVIAPDRISSTSFGGVHPEVAGESALNRRVDIVVMTDLPAATADRIPEVVAHKPEVTDRPEVVDRPEAVDDKH